MPVNSTESLPVPSMQGGTNPTHQWGVQLGDQYSAPIDLELLAGTGRFQQIGVTVAGFSTAGSLSTPFYGYASPTDGRILLGTVMGRVTSTKMYVPYHSTASDGSQVPVGVLRHTVDTTNGPVFGNLVTSGILRASLMSGAAITDAYIFGGLAGNASGYYSLNGRVDNANDQFIF